MNEALKNIDSDLIDLEVRLLVEISRLRKLNSDETYSELEPSLKSELKVIYSALVDALAATANAGELSLKSDEQMWIEDRMRVVRNLLVSKLPTAFLTLSHNEHLQHKLEPGESEKHAASRELRILSVQVNQHVREGRSIEEIQKERAQFDSKELTSAYIQPTIKRDIAQTPDEIRKKLAGKSGSMGPSSFVARDIASNTPPPPQFAAASGSKEIAQTPEAIKAKLSGRQAGGAGKASFGSKDVQSVADRMALTESKRKKPEQPEKRTGKATFSAKDLD